MPKFHILFINSKLHQRFLKNGYYNYWMKQYFGSNLDWDGITLLGSSVDRFLILQTNRQMRQLNQAEEVVTKILSLKVCLHCELHSNSAQITQISVGSFSSKNLDFFLISEVHNPEEKTKWVIETRLTSLYEIYQNFHEYFNLCSDNPFESSSATDFANRMVTHIWRIIMNNYTHPIYERKGRNWMATSNECTNGVVWEDARHLQYSSVLLRIETKLRFPEHFIFSIPNDAFSLRFVSCGRPKLSAFVFHELLSVFQWPIWLSVVVAVFSLLLFKLLIIDLARKNTVMQLVMACLHLLQMLVEQSSSFTESNKSNAWRFSLGLYIFVGIILSNAYRNTNVYNMVKPRVPIPYETFDQLVNDDFIIFSRNAISANFESFPAGGLLDKSWVYVPPHAIWFRDSNLRFLMSELKTLEITVQNRDQKRILMSGPMKLLQKHSKLHSDLVRAFNDTGIEYLRHKNNASGDKSREFWSKKLAKTEQSMLEAQLKECRKTAVILPTHLLQSIATNMGHLENLYFGKKPLLKSVIGFDISGYTPPHIFSRIEAINRAGILQRWLILSKDKSASQLNHNAQQLAKPWKPDMSGNMLIIFVVLLSGLISSFLAFSVESVQKICRRIITILRLAWSQFVSSSLKFISLVTITKPVSENIQY